MTDRHKIKPRAVRMPDGLPARVDTAAKARGETFNGFVVAAIEERLAQHEGGSTTPAAPRKRGSTTASKRPGAPARRTHALNCKCGICRPKDSKR